MKSIEFPEQTHKIAEHQEDYQTLPAYIDAGDGIVTCCFELTDEEVDEVIKTKQIWHTQYIGNDPMQPIMMMAKKPNLQQTEVKPKSKIIT